MQPGTDTKSRRRDPSAYCLAVTGQVRFWYWGSVTTDCKLCAIKGNNRQQPGQCRLLLSNNVCTFSHYAKPMADTYHQLSRYSSSHAVATPNSDTIHDAH